MPPEGYLLHIFVTGEGEQNVLQSSLPSQKFFFDLYYVMPKYWTLDKKRTFTGFFSVVQEVK